MIPSFELAPGYTIPGIINGGWQLSTGHTQRNLDENAVLQALMDLASAGFTAFDCADIYTGVEELFGRFLRRWRERSTTPIRIHTKYVPNLADLAHLKKEDITATIDRSLQRLGVDCLDLVQFHWWDYDVPGYIEAADHMKTLQQEGKILHLGVTNFDVKRMEELVTAGIKPVSIQLQYSLLDRRPENGMADFCHREGIHMLCYGTLAGGYLTDRYLGMPAEEEAENRSLTKYRLIIREFGGWGLYQELLRMLREVANQSEADIARIATAWTLARPGVGAAIVGARHAGHIASNRAALNTRLSPEHQALLGGVLARSRGPAGDPFDLERIKDGIHSSIMKTNLN